MVGRYAWPLYALRDGTLSAERAAAIAETIDSGRGAPTGRLPGAYSHRTTELVSELRLAGLHLVRNRVPITAGFLAGGGLTLQSASRLDNHRAVGGSAF